jgi:hypothetical protein
VCKNLNHTSSCQSDPNPAVFGTVPNQTTPCEPENHTPSSPTQLERAKRAPRGALALREPRGLPKVAQLEVGPGGGDAQQVLGLEVPVHNAAVVQVPGELGGVAVVWQLRGWELQFGRWQ